MNTIHDLRDTLAEHAEIHDVEIGTRSSSIARRVRVVRRRRAAGVAGAAAAAVVAATVGLSNLGTGTHAAPVASVLGIDVPATLTSTGYTFDYASSVKAPAGSHVASVTIDPADGPVLVSWATEGAAQDVHVTTPATDFHSALPDFTDFIRVDPFAGRTTVEVSGASRTALAVYHLGATPPAGVTTDGITYRRDVDDRHLVDARIAPAGANRLSFDVTMPSGPSGPSRKLIIADLCSATGSGRGGDAWVEGSINGREAWKGGCGTSSTFDPAGAGSMGFGNVYRAGQRVRIDVRLLDRPGGQPLQDPHARLGIGAYVLAQQPQVVGGGLSLPRTIESAGHTWTLASSNAATVRQGAPWRIALPTATERRMVVLVASGGGGPTSIIPLVDGHDRDAWLGLEPRSLPASETVGPVDATSRTVGARVRGSSAGAALGIYELAD